MHFLRLQRGQTAAEYLGVLVVISAIIGVLATTDAGAKIATEIERAICKIAQRENCAPKGDKPPSCTRNASSDKIGAEIEAKLKKFNVGVGGSVQVAVTERGDGSYAVNIKGSLDGKLGKSLESRFGSEIAAYLTGGGEAGATLKFKDRAAVDRFKGQLGDALKPRLPCIFRCGDDPINKIEWPELESVGVTGKAGGEANASITAETPYAEVEGNLGLKGQHAVGAEVKTSGKDKGDVTLHYEYSASGEAGAKGKLKGPLADFVEGAIGGKLSGRAKIAITVDKNGNPKSLKLTGVGEAEGGGTLGGGEKPGANFGDTVEQLGKMPTVSAKRNVTNGKGVEASVTLDLTDPALRDSARRAFTGVDDSGGQTSRAEALKDLGRAARDSTDVSVRNYDFKRDTKEVGVDADVIKAGGSYEQRDERTTGYRTLDPTTGQWTEDRRCLSGGGKAAGAGR